MEENGSVSLEGNGQKVKSGETSLEWICFKNYIFIRFVLLGHLASSSGLHYINGTKGGIHSLSALKHR